MNAFPPCLRSTARIACLLPCLISALHAEPIRIKAGAPPGSEVAQAIQLLSKGDLKAADAAFARTPETDPSHLEAALGRAQIAITGKQLDKAEQMVNAVLQAQPALPEAHNMKGLLHLLRKNPDAARGEFTRAIQLQPRYVTPRVYLAVMASQAGDYAGAAVQYKGLIDVAPRYPAGYLGQAEALTMQHRESDALRVLESWKAADPDSLLPYQVIANVDLSDHKPQQAIDQLNAALANKPTDSATLALLGDAYSAAGDTRTATAKLEAALYADPNNTNAALHLGTLEAATNQSDLALEHFRTVLKADPNNAVAANNAAWLLADQGKDLNEAQRLAQLATRRDPHYADAHDTLGWIDYRRGAYAPAVAELKQAKQLAPANLSVAAHLGLAYAKTGNKPQALAELNRALSGGNTVSNRPELERVVASLSAPPSSSHMKSQ